MGANNMLAQKYGGMMGTVTSTNASNYATANN